VDGEAVITPTGQQITTAVGSAHGLAWAPVDTGTTVTWTEVDIAA